MNSFYKTADTFKQGAHTLPQKYYIDNSVLKLEMEKIFGEEWLCCGRHDELLKQGNYKVVNIGDESIIVLRDENKKLQAFYNVCRHRGTQICINEKESFSKTIQCPYHGWTYNLQGGLHRAPNMDAIIDFNKNNYSLHSIQIKEWEGFIFINLSENSNDFLLEYKSVINHFIEWGIEDLKIINKKNYYVNCNWKLIIQNYSECYHCPIIHPNLANITPYTGGRNDLVEGKFLGGYMEMKSKSITYDGNLCAPTIGTLSKENLNRVYYYSLFPNMLLSLHPDYIMFHIIYPLNAEKSKIDCTWLFSKGVEHNKNYNVNNAIDFWDKINQEDWKICEQSQLGIKSKKYIPGPYSGQESLLAAYDEYYLSILNKN